MEPRPAAAAAAAAVGGGTLRVAASPRGSRSNSGLLVPFPSWEREAAPDESCADACVGESFELLRWSVLAASTIGPGTVIVCSKAGSDFGLVLLWALVLASFVAYALQEGSARLALIARTTLGGAMRTVCGGARARTPIPCALVAAGVFVGNAAYQANNFVGAAEALMALGAPRDDAFARALIHFGIGGAVLATLFLADVDRVSAALGGVSVLMIVTFAAALAELGVDGAALVRGLFPSPPPPVCKTKYS
jgi:Mn2+/Fe2+ NRAMP family transporter